jgi:hypothetical protein
MHVWKLTLTVLALVAAVPRVSPGREEAPSGTNAPPVRARAKPKAVYDPYFFGYELDPAMDFGARNLTGLYGGICRLTAWATFYRRFPYTAPIYEIPLAYQLTVVEHEVFGHGGRGREYDLDPTFQILLFAGSTSIDKDPESNEQLIMLCAGGTESDSVWARRLLLDLYSKGGGDGSKIPLLIAAKSDFPLYCQITPNPADSADDFVDAYTNGNDIAYYLVSRQAQVRGADPVDVWNGDFFVDTGDPAIRANYDQVQEAALWTLADPATLATLFSYVWDHVIRGRTRVRPPIIPFGGGYGLTAGTRAFLGPADVSRLLDIYFVTPNPVIWVSGRELRNTDETGYGFGVGYANLKIVRGIYHSFSADWWQVPENAEGLYEGDGWNVCHELNCLFAGHIGFSAKLGYKSEGFHPGTPMTDGLYGGGGVLWAF